MLFRLAEQCDMMVELSQLFRRLAVVFSKRLRPGSKLFLNVHAAEISSQSFFDSLAKRSDWRRRTIRL